MRAELFHDMALGIQAQDIVFFFHAFPDGGHGKLRHVLFHGQRQGKLGVYGAVAQPDFPLHPAAVGLQAVEGPGPGQAQGDVFQHAGAG